MKITTKIILKPQGHLLGHEMPGIRYVASNKLRIREPSSYEAKCKNL